MKQPSPLKGCPPHHIALKVRALDRCGEFYARTLGLPLRERHEDEAGMLRSLWFDLQGTILMLEQCEEGAGTPASSHAGWHLVALTIAPESRQEWKERLAQAGVLITGESRHSLYFSDPEGNRLALSHYPHAH